MRHILLTIQRRESAGSNRCTMDYLFTDLIGHETQTFYVIGNGFDLFHNIPSKYQNFYHWLKSIGEDEFVKNIESIWPQKFGDQSLLWYDFEKALETYDIDRLFNKYGGGYDIAWDEKVATAAIEKIHPIIKDIPQKIKQWAKSFDIVKVGPKLPLPTTSLYLTFNYTDTLEVVYKIPSDRICHIHGRCNKVDENILVGHHKMVPINQIENKDYPFLEEQGKINIAKEMNTLYKDCHANIDNNKRFFSLLKNIDRVVILGHSMSDIDLPYLGRIKNEVSQDTHWFISKYCPSDETLIKRGLGALGIKDNNRWIINL